MIYNDFLRAIAYERITGQQPDIPDPRLGIGAAEKHESLTTAYMLQRQAPAAAKTQKVKTDDDIKYLGDGKQISQSDFSNTGYIGEVL